MLFTALAAALLAAPPQFATRPCTPTTACVPDNHGKLAWFEGTYEQALTRAASSNKLVFISFWKRW